jgi:hypothetical protein
MLDKDVTKFWHVNYHFWNSCFQVNLWTCIPSSNSILQQHFDFGGPIFFNFVSRGAWPVSFWWTMYKLGFLILGLCILVDRGKMQVLITWLWISRFWLSMSKLRLLIFNLWTLVVIGRLGFVGFLFLIFGFWWT